VGDRPRRAAGAASSAPVFVTCVRGTRDAAAAGLLLDSLRTFGGELSDQPVWVFAADSARDAVRSLHAPGIDILSLQVPRGLADLPFAAAVVACAAAEERAAAGSLVWIDPECLIVRSPVLFDLGDDADVALRPVHLRNVGSPCAAPVDDYWRRVYAAAGASDVGLTVESFADGQRLRGYFNSHAQVVRPSLRVFRRRCEVLEQLAADASFLTDACRDEAHRVFLFQAVFAAVVGAVVDPVRVRILPPSYNYPYNLQELVPRERRATALDELVCFAYEGRSLRPERVTDVAIREPLRSWLAARAGRTPAGPHPPLALPTLPRPSSGGRMRSGEAERDSAEG
jgi:hypothetical protein